MGQLTRLLKRKPYLRGEMSVEVLVGIILVLIAAAVIFLMIQGNFEKISMWLSW